MRLIMKGFPFLLLMFSSTCSSQMLLDADLPEPRIVITGPTGSGKSSMANSLLGCDPASSGCLFEVCHDMDSCTKETTYGTGQWLGQGENFTVVDTPGFGDSDGEDPVLITEMLNVLKDTIQHASTILLVLKGTETRFNDALQDMLTKMTMSFGDQWWDYTVIGVSFWKLDQESIDQREAMCEHYPDNCKNEEWFMREITSQLEEKFHINKNFTFAFIDSYSQAWPDNEDPIQQQHFKEETEVLWKETTSRNSTLFFKGIDDVLQENAEMKEKIQWLEDIITKNISALMSRMDENEANDNIQDKTIEHNEDTASTERTLLRLDIINNNEIMTTVTGELSEDIGEVNQDLTEVRNDLIPGIGSIIPWIPSPDGPSEMAPGKIPIGWQKCDGSMITSGPLINLRTPDLNGQGLFLRGGDDSIVTTVQEDMVLDHSHKDPGHSHSDTGHSHTQTSHSHLPPLWDNGQHNEFVVLNDASYPGSEMYLISTHDGQNTDDEPHWYYSAHQAAYTDLATPAILSAKASISSDLTGVSTITDQFSKGAETRPKNMVVTYIMRIL